MSIDISTNIEIMAEQKSWERGRLARNSGRGRPWSGSGRVAGIGCQAGALDAVHGADLVLVRGVAADPDGTDDLAAGVANQDAARHRHDPSARGGHQRLQENRVGGGAAREFAAAKPHAENAPRLSAGDLGAQQTRAVVA